MSGLREITVEGARVVFDSRVGNLRHVEFDVGGRVVEPLHTAPWVDDPEILADESIAPVEARLSGDFFCAPFCGNDVEPAPVHGWPANSDWDEIEVDVQPSGVSARFGLQKKVMGAALEKQIQLVAGVPVLYQTHRLVGGEGALPVAHHPITRMAAGGALCFSPKALAMTAGDPLEPGRNWLAYPARGEVTAFPGADGQMVDLTRYPTETGHEDAVVLIEAPGRTLGWTAILRDAEDDIVFIVKDPRVLPVTMLWFSNGGRDFSPWNGRHKGVLGIEDGCCAGALGHAAALVDNPFSEVGVETAMTLRPDGERVVHHALGAVARPAGWQAVADIQIDGDDLILTERDGETIKVPFLRGFFG